MSEVSNKRAILVGVFVMLGLIFLLAGVLMVGNLHQTFKKKVEVTALFEDVNGLQKGNNIWFSGVKVGTVSSLRLYGESKVSVILNIETKSLEYIRKDAKVKISTDGLIGNKILVIFGGSEQFEAVKEGDTLMVQPITSTEEMMNTFQESNKNILAITTDVKAISKGLTDGKGSIGKLLKDETVYNNINTATAALKSTSETMKSASQRAQVLINTLAQYSQDLNKKGTLVNELTTDTTVFNSIRISMLELQEIADTASVLVKNLKETAQNPKSSLGVLLHDEEAGAQVKETMKNLESSTEKLNENLAALQYSFLLRRAFKKKAKAEQQAKLKN